MSDSTSSPAANTRSAAKECKVCDYCLIKKELSRINQMILCPFKVQQKKMLDELNPPDKKRKVKKEEEENGHKEIEKENTIEVQ